MGKAMTRRMIFGVLLAAWVALPALAQDPQVNAARLVALDWLAVVDAGNAAGSWNSAGKRFQETMTQDQWAQALAQSRGTFGPLKQRAMHDAQTQVEFPGQPPGDYALIQFRASFEKRESAVETLSLLRGPDGKWQVIGYSIR